MSTFGIASVLLVDVGTFLFAAGVLLFFIRIPGDDAVNRVQKRGFEPPFAGLREGLAFLKQDAAVQTMILIFVALNFFSRISYENILSPMVLSRSGSRQVLGLVSGILGFGGVIGGILAARLLQPKDLPLRIFLPGILGFLFSDLLMGAGRAACLGAGRSGRQPAHTGAGFRRAVFALYPCAQGGVGAHLCRAQRTAIRRNPGGDFSGRRAGRSSL